MKNKYILILCLIIGLGSAAPTLYFLTRPREFKHDLAFSFLWNRAAFDFSNESEIYYCLIFNDGYVLWNRSYLSQADKTFRREKKAPNDFILGRISARNLQNFQQTINKAYGLDPGYSYDCICGPYYLDSSDYEFFSLTSTSIAQLSFLNFSPEISESDVAENDSCSAPSSVADTKADNAGKVVKNLFFLELSEVQPVEVQCFRDEKRRQYRIPTAILLSRNQKLVISDRSGKELLTKNIPCELRVFPTPFRNAGLSPEDEWEKKISDSKSDSGGIPKDPPNKYRSDSRRISLTR